MGTVADLVANKAARAEATHAAAQKMKTLWPTRFQPWPKCRGTEGECNSGRPPGRDGFCSVCHKRVVTLIVRGYDVHPLTALRVSYATYRAKTPQSAPKPNRKPMASRVFTDADLVTFPTPDQVQAAKALVVAPESAPTMRDMLNRVHDPDLTTPATPPPTTWAADADTIDALRRENATLRAQLRDPTHLRAALARIDAKAAEIANLKARLAELENE